MSGTTKGKTYRTSKWLEKHLPKVTQIHRAVDESYSQQSTYARLALTEDVRLWCHSPYVALSARHFLFVGADGEFIYRRSERLCLNSQLDHIPASIEMKHAKIRAYLDGCPAQTNVIDHLRARWKCVNFALWANGELIDEKDDPHGITSKSARLSCNLSAGLEVTREIHVVLDDYVQWFAEGDLGGNMDGVEIDIDIPTLDLEVCVVLDERIYRDTDFRRRPPLTRGAMHFELQTVEGRRLLSAPNELLGKVANVTPLVGEPLPDYHEMCAHVRSAWEEAQSGFSRVKYEAPPFPCRTFFYRLRGARQNPGLRNTLTWPRPIRPTSSCGEHFDRPPVPES